jgi:hypothetical protein
MVEFSQKQIRNGTEGTTDTRNTAQPGPDATAQVGGLMSKSQGAAEQWQGEGAAIISGAPGQPAGDSMFDWDDGLAIGEQPGEM